MKLKLTLAAISLIVFAGIISATVSAGESEVDENGLNKKQQCLVKANDKFLKYLEDNSTTYKFDDGTIINLPHKEIVIEDAKRLLKHEESKC